MYWLYNPPLGILLDVPSCASSKSSKLVQKNWDCIWATHDWSDATCDGLSRSWIWPKRLCPTHITPCGLSMNSYLQDAGTRCGWGPREASHFLSQEASSFSIKSDVLSLFLILFIICILSGSMHFTVYWTCWLLKVIPKLFLWGLMYFVLFILAFFCLAVLLNNYVMSTVLSCLQCWMYLFSSSWCRTIPLVAIKVLISGFGWTSSPY